MVHIVYILYVTYSVYIVYTICHHRKNFTCPSPSTHTPTNWRLTGKHQDNLTEQKLTSKGIHRNQCPGRKPRQNAFQTTCSVGFTPKPSYVLYMNSVKDSLPGYQAKTARHAKDQTVWRNEASSEICRYMRMLGLSDQGSETGIYVLRILMGKVGKWKNWAM